MSRQQVVPGLAAEGYARHAVHAPDRLWVEKNCYVDVLIEMLHALRLEPLAAMGFCAAIDFEGDNFTFFKPNHEELRLLYGVDMQEMNVWLPLIEHARHHLGAGKFISTEANSFWLPDTAGTDYRRNHVKSTIILADLDEAAKRLGYFHNAGYFELDGEDFDALFRIGAAPDPTFLPLFAELVRIDRLVRRPRAALASLAAGRLSVQLGRRPSANPVRSFQSRFEQELPRMQELGLAHYHAWAFATTRQLGASSELLSLHLRWVEESGGIDGVEPAAEHFLRLSATAKTFILKAARAVNNRKPFDAAPMFDEMASAWDAGMATLDQRFARQPEGASHVKPVGALRVGIDLVQISRIAESLEQFGERFLRRVFTTDEIAYASEAPGRTSERLASRFAAKEATMKALRLVEDPCDWRHIEVRRSPSGACELVLHGTVRDAASRLGAGAFALSLSHEGDYATAVVITTIHETTHR